MFLTEALPALDRVGRKPLLLLGSVGMTIALARLVLAVGSGTTNAQGQLVLVSPANVIALAAANIYAFFFAFTWGPVARVLLGEMFGRARTDVNTRRAPDCLT